MLLRAPETRSDRDEHLQRAVGTARLTVEADNGVNRVSHQYQRHPLKFMFPRLPGQCVSEVVVVNTSGGIAGADELDLSISAQCNAALCVSSQAAEKVYRALSRPARITTHLAVREHATLAWLPQETIVFNRVRLIRSTEVDLDGTGQLLALEWLILGRTGHGEILTAGDIADRWHIRIGGRLKWADSFRLSGAVFPNLHRKALLSGATALCTLVSFGPHPQRQLDFFQQHRSLVDCQLAATTISGLTIVRALARTASSLRGAMRILLTGFAREFGSECFQVPKVWSC